MTSQLPETEVRFPGMVAKSKCPDMLRGVSGTLLKGRRCPDKVDWKRCKIYVRQSASPVSFPVSFEEVPNRTSKGEE